MKKIFTLLFLGATLALSAQNLLTNGSFESWTDGKPDGWFGSKTNIAVSKAIESADAQDGAKSLNLINTGSSHKRFTSQPFNLTADTAYTLTYYIKGEGEVRNSFFNGNIDSNGGGYATYSPYTTASGSWQQVTYTFETDVDVTDMEMIFSVRNTSEEGILIDNAVLVQGGEVTVIEVSTIAELRAGTVGSTIYELTGEALLTYTVTNRHQKYIQDATGGILIDDVAGRLGDDYSIGDKIAGITGTLATYNGLMQFIPTEEGEDAVSTGNAVNYEMLTLSEYLANPTAYESKYIAIEELMVADAEEGDGTFQNGKNYPLTNGGQEIVGRTQFFDIPLIGQALPTVPSLVIGFGARFNETIQIFMTEVNDGLMGVADLNADAIVMTTVWNNEANFVTKGNASVEIYNLNGQLIQKANGNNTFNVNVSSLTKGVYVVKVTVDGKTTVKKAVKK